ncbi:hypothetical protein, partial [Corallococcus sp. AB049A]|uniref:hypothetical protein n=1 Tax=Corallococcus sp. AB049A TaxID=2316721 RepID=UPI0013150639
FWPWRNWFWKWRLKSKAAGTFDGSQKNLKKMYRSARMETVRMRGYASHRVHRNWAANYFFVLSSCPIGPRNVEFDLLIECSFGELDCDPSYLIRIDAASSSNGVRAVLVTFVSLSNQLKCWNGISTVR